MIIIIMLLFHSKNPCLDIDIEVIAVDLRCPDLLFFICVSSYIQKVWNIRLAHIVLKNFPFLIYLAFFYSLSVTSFSELDLTLSSPFFAQCHNNATNLLYIRLSQSCFPNSQMLFVLFIIYLLSMGSKSLLYMASIQNNS